jgi:hypothetical protein
MQEEWKEVLGFDILYEVSNLGRVRTRYDEKKGYTKEYRFVSPRDNGHGYLCFNWKQKKHQRTVYLHRLVAENFVENPNRHTEINHKDEDKTNNRAENLEWCEHKYNCNYGTRNQRSATSKKKPVECIETGAVYSSANEAARQNGICKTAILNCIHGRTKTSGGYTWRFANV